MRRLFAIFSFVSIAALMGCASGNNDTGCKKDDDCNAGFVCQTETGACRCRTDDVCPDGNYCNAFGSCQARPPCLGNQDCADGFLCNSADPSGGTCIADTGCGSSVHCELGSFCNPQTKVCTPGCRGTGDCALGDVCVQGQCVVGGTADDCTICPVTGDPDSSYCDYGEVCTHDGECEAAPNQAHLCDDCTASNTCNGSLICLIDPDSSSASYCAPPCQIDADCPSGYQGCGGLQLVDPNAECSNNSECGTGSVCQKGPESNRGFCSCVSDVDCNSIAGVCLGGLFGCLNVDRDCSSDTDCACVDNACINSGLPCSNGDDCNVSCVEGSCITNQKACGKVSGKTCTDLKTGEAACEDH